MNPVLQTLLSASSPLLITAVVALLGWVGNAAVSWLQTHQKVAALAFVATAVQTALAAAAKAAGADIGKPTPQLLADAASAAKAAIAGQWPDIEAALDQELDVLLPWVLASQVNVPQTAVVAAMAAPRK